MFFVLAFGWSALCPDDSVPRADRPLPVQMQIITSARLAAVVDRDEIPCGWRLISTGGVLNISGNVFSIEEAAQGSADHAKKPKRKQIVIKVLDIEKTEMKYLLEFSNALRKALGKGDYAVVYVILIEPEKKESK